MSQALRVENVRVSGSQCEMWGTMKWKSHGSAHGVKTIVIIYYYYIYIIIIVIIIIVTIIIIIIIYYILFLLLLLYIITIITIIIFTSTNLFTIFKTIDDSNNKYVITCYHYHYKHYHYWILSSISLSPLICSMWVFFETHCHWQSWLGSSQPCSEWAGEDSLSGFGRYMKIWYSIT